MYWKTTFRPYLGYFFSRLNHPSPLKSILTPRSTQKRSTPPRKQLSPIRYDKEHRLVDGWVLLGAAFPRHCFCISLILWSQKGAAEVCLSCSFIQDPYVWCSTCSSVSPCNVSSSLSSLPCMSLASHLPVRCFPPVRFWGKTLEDNTHDKCIYMCVVF